jgi:hypothetical protein
VSAVVSVCSTMSDQIPGQDRDQKLVDPCTLLNGTLLARFPSDHGTE